MCKYHEVPDIILPLHKIRILQLMKTGCLDMLIDVRPMRKIGKFIHEEIDAKLRL